MKTSLHSTPLYYAPLIHSLSHHGQFLCLPVMLSPPPPFSLRRTCRPPRLLGDPRLRRRRRLHAHCRHALQHGRPPRPDQHRPLKKTPSQGPLPLRPERCPLKARLLRALRPPRPPNQPSPSFENPHRHVVFLRPVPPRRHAVADWRRPRRAEKDPIVQPV